MKKHVLLLATLSLWLATPLAAATLETDSHSVFQQTARTAIAQFQKELGGALQSAITQNGPMEAIGVCKEQAPQIARRIGGLYGVDIGRTALRLRNGSNQPETWQKETLESFAARLKAGEPLEAIYAYRTDKNSSEYMQPIPVKEACTLCHGTAVAPELRQKISTLYPQDQATGFAIGDLRGAFWVKSRAP